MEEQSTLFQRVNNIIEKDIKPYIEADGGKIKLQTVSDDGIVMVQLSGACAGCPGAVMTLKGGVERVLRMKISEISEVKLAY